MKPLDTLCDKTLHFQKIPTKSVEEPLDWVRSQIYNSKFTQKISPRDKKMVQPTKVLQLKNVLASTFCEKRAEKGVNPFHAFGLFLHPLKTSENLWEFLCFLGVKRETRGMELVKQI